jgi:hydroxyacylglutathione hydrolase
MSIQYESEEICIFESALYRTTSTLIIGDDYILLVDPNWLPAEIDFIEKTAALKGRGKEKFLLFTHSDYDHIIGYGKFKDYKAIASLNFVRNEGQAAILQQIQKFDDEYYIKRAYDIEYPKIDIVIAEDCEKKSIGSDEYLFFQATGHNKDGLITYNKSKGILIAGDYLSNIEFPYLYDSWNNYMNTLSTFDAIINQHPVQLLVPGHGDLARAVSEMSKRIAEAKSYLLELADAVKSHKAFDEKRLFERYDFPMIMRQFHQNNVKLVAAEIAQT